MISNNNVSNFYPSRKSRFSTESKDMSEKGMFELKKVILQKIDLGENPLGDCPRIATIDPNSRDIR